MDINIVQKFRNVRLILESDICQITLADLNFDKPFKISNIYKIQTINKYLYAKYTYNFYFLKFEKFEISNFSCFEISDIRLITFTIK